MRIAPLSLLLVGLGLVSFGATACRSSNEARPDPAPPPPSSLPRAPMPPSEQGSPTPPPATASAAPSASSASGTGSAAPAPSTSGARTAPAGSGASGLVAGHGRDGGATAPGRGECTADSDCRAWSDTCGDCTCRPLAKTATAPKCTRSQVQCFVDPCRAKRGVCKAGTCALNDDGAM
ncbi:hypothetical protein LVJ94_19205 [Pendulispora rubella]|uniref:Uncharacterized protein n=1 Tax=Pendulispora rubella TaxID=2741070 RepID=A0ABZ2LHU3_9BACT